VLVIGAAVVALLGLAIAAASAPGSPVRAGAPESSDTPSAIFLAAAACAFAFYLLGLLVLGRGSASLAAVCATAAAIQLLPLAGPLLLSQDVYAYWAYGRIAEDHGANPYRTTPARFASDPAERAMAPAWRRADSVYGPVFTAASAGLAEVDGRSAEHSAFVYRGLAALGMLALVAIAALAAPSPAFAAAFVGWNPLLALQFAGGGHNDVWLAVLLAGALALAARGRVALSGATWAVAAGVKWVPLALLPLTLLARRPGAGRLVVAFVAAAGAICALSFAFFGWAWVDALLPFAHRHSAYALPSRLADVGVPGWLAFLPLAAALPWLVRSARRGRPRLAVATMLMLCASPWLLPWYAVWVAALAAIEDDALAWPLVLALSVYLLPDRVPF
jgi:Glycosyltransferase family 87